MKIGICDDEKIILELLEEKVQDCLIENDWKAEIVLFMSGAETVEAAETLDVLFLDIEMPEMDGIKVGKLVRQKNTACKIIMATSKIERVKEAFYIEAFRFITKPFSGEEIKEAMESVMKGLVGKQTILVYENRIPYEIMQCDIKYVEAYDSYCEFESGNKRMRKEVSLQKLEEILEQELFFRINRRYIVNLLFVESYTEGAVDIGGKKIEVSRRKRKTFEKCYREFDLKYR